MPDDLDDQACPAPDDLGAAAPPPIPVHGVQEEATRVMPSSWIPHGAGQPVDTEADESEPPSEPRPSADPAAGIWAEVAARLTAIEAAIASFQERSAHREGVIDRLHEERVEHRAGIRRTILDPVTADLIRLFDGLDSEAQRLASAGETRLSDLLASFADDAELALERCGLDALRPRPGEPFQKSLHTAGGSVPVDDPAAHNTIAGVLQTGFVDRDSGRVRRPAKARVYRLREPPGTAAADGPPAPAAPAG
jgi:molecular chaperone GrpE (heat shock protein)